MRMLSSVRPTHTAPALRSEPNYQAALLRLALMVGAADLNTASNSDTG